MKIYIVRSPATPKPELIDDVSVFAPKDYVYFCTQNFDGCIADMYKEAKEKNEWIRRYDNLKRGLEYWRARALEK